MVEFYWKVPEPGFAWKTADTANTNERGQFLAEQAPVGQLITYRNYPALKKPALFKTFAGTPRTPEGVLTFANQYGFLGTGQVGIKEAVGPKDNTWVVVSGETLEVWSKEIEDMSHAVNLWEAASGRDSNYLSKFIKWHGPEAGWQRGGVSYLPPFRGVNMRVIPLASPEYASELMSLFAEGDLVLPARHALHLLVNEKIQQHGAQFRLLWDRTHGTLRETVRVMPKSLISALWIQFANAIEGDRKYRQCDECREWFELAGYRRADARFCSDPCRFKAYRKRQNQARSMSAQGVPVKEIAKQLGSDVKTVKGWISER